MSTVFRRFRKRFEHKPESGEKTIYPRDWAGEIDPEIAKIADDGGFTIVERKVKSLKASNSKPQGGSELAKPLADMTVDELKKIAEAEGVTIKSDDKKDDIVKAIEEKRKAG